VNASPSHGRRAGKPLRIGWTSPRRRFARPIQVFSTLTLAAACASAPRAATGEEGPLLAAADEVDRESLPLDGAGPADSTGFLDRDDVRVRMAAEGLIVDLFPMNPEVVSLATDDLRRFLEEAYRKIPDTVPPDLKQNGTIFLIGFSATEKEISFEPSRVALNSEGRQYYPRVIVPISQGFESKVLQILKAPVWGVYIFEPGIDLVSTLEFTYGELASSGASWRRVIQNVELARSRAKR
jgi:hypothetical protein